MKKAVLGLAVLALAAGSCSGAGAVVATVDGTEILLSEVESLRPDGSGAVSVEDFSDDLLNTIVEIVVVQRAASEFGIEFDDASIEARLEELKQQIADQTGLEYEDFLEQQGLTDDRVRRIARQQLVAEAVEERLVAAAPEPTAEEIDTRYQQNLYGFTEACVSHILVATEEEAESAKARIDGGEDFAAVAMELGTDGTAPEGGSLGCASLAGYVPEFAQAALDAPIGVVTGPVRSQFGFHVILVDSRDSQELDDVRDALLAQIDAERRGTLVQEWLLAVVAESDIQIDPKYGSWTNDPFPQVLPPQ